MTELKDTEKAYPLTTMMVRVFNDAGVQIFADEVERISHFGVVRDYTIKLKDGTEILLDFGVVEQIVKHENDESDESSLNVISQLNKKPTKTIRVSIGERIKRPDLIMGE